MASLSSHQQGGITTAHSCDHGKHFTVHLFDDVGELRTDKPIWRNPNPSQTELALRIHGDDFWTIEWEAYRNHFLRATDGISFFNTSKSDLSLAVAAGCLLARRFLQCLRDDELPAQWAVGVKIVTSYSLELGILDVETLRWEMLLGGDEDDEPDNVYSIVATKGSTAAQLIDNHPMNTKPGATGALMEAKNWLEDCQQNHATCIKPLSTFTPTRLIQILPHEENMTCCLREMSASKVEPYAALSYCWGGDQTFKTTLQTLPRYLNGIDPAQLPQTLQDAIFVTGQLGLQYIWIDALCIIQDSATDKAFEIGQMARVYSNSTITVAATRAKAVWDGFLSERAALERHLPHKTFNLPCQAAREDFGTLSLIPFTHESVDPLYSRGWTFQERVLSPRVLDFGTMRTQYTCQTTLGEMPSDGWSNHPMDRAYGSGLDAQIISDLVAGVYPKEDMLQYWSKIVQGFTNRGLSFVGDKLPAIAGMAEYFGTIMKDQYCVGIWRRSLPGALIWTTGTKMQHIDDDLEPRLHEIAIPSWSWAAVGRAVNYDPLYTTPDSHLHFEAEIKDCVVELSDERSPYGAVKGGMLVLQAYVRQATWARENIYGDPRILLAVDDGIEEQPEALNLGFRRGNSMHINFIPDALEKESQEDPKSVIDVYLLLIGTTQPSKETGMSPTFFGLVVREIPGNERVFSRLGVFRKTLNWPGFSDYLDWFRRERKKTLTIL